jgi:dolichol-phosphate mannosyltransferase
MSVVLKRKWRKTLMSDAEQQNNFSIIIPTYLEANNLPLLIKRISELGFDETNFEVIVVDDNSSDGTADRVTELSQTHPWLKLILRRDARSWSKSVLAGIQIAKFPILIFMDADLSHPPETIIPMLAALKKPNIEMVIGSRYMRGGSIDKKWPFYRNLISRMATWIIRPLLPSKIKDPLSGFIAVRKPSDILNEKLWNPIGTKLGLEIIVKSHLKNIIEIPIYFGQRQFGESKLMNMKSVLRYLEQIRQLWLYKLLGHKLRS